MTASPSTPGFTGRHMAATLVAGFGVVLTVNVVMARYASSTFSGVVVENAYVASQDFNGWLRQAAQSKALNWQVGALRRPDGKVAVQLGNVPAGATVQAVARHPLGQANDITLRFAPHPKGQFISTEALPAGRWTLRIEVTGGGQHWRGEQDVR